MSIAATGELPVRLQANQFLATLAQPSGTEQRYQRIRTLSPRSVVPYSHSRLICSSGWHRLPTFLRAPLRKAHTNLSWTKNTGPCENHHRSLKNQPHTSHRCSSLTHCADVAGSLPIIVKAHKLGHIYPSNWTKYGSAS